MPVTTIPSYSNATTSKIDSGTFSARQTIEGLSIPAHDHIALSYTGANLTGVSYKLGGSSGQTVATLALAYDGSSNLTSVTKT